MRLFGKEIRFSLREKFRGFWAKSGMRPKWRIYPGELAWTERCKYWDDIYERHSLAKSCILSIAGRVLEQGLFLEASGEYARAEEAKERCEQLNQEIGIAVLLYDTIVSWSKYGSCFWEKTTNPTFDVKIIPSQELIEPSKADDLGNITHWRQNTWGTSQSPEWPSNEIIHFAWNITSKSWPYGTSLLIGSENEFDILDQLETDIKEHMHKTAFPGELWQVGDGQYVPTGTEASAIKSDVKNWEPGEKFVTSYPIKREASAPGEKTIANLADVLAFCRDNITDSLMISPISKLYNSTYASSKEMQEMEKARLIVPMQRLIAFKLKNDLYKPYLESLGYSVRTCPEIKWQSPDADKVENGEYWAMQVQSGIVPAEYAAEQQGFDMDKLKQYRVEEDRRREEQLQFQKVSPFKPKASVSVKGQSSENPE